MLYKTHGVSKLSNCTGPLVCAMWRGIGVGGFVSGVGFRGPLKKKVEKVKYKNYEG